MDLMYLPDAFTFHVIRSPPIYNARGYDYLDAMLEEEEEARRRKMRKAKEKNEKPTQCAGAGTKKENHLSTPGKSSSKDSCPMCKEKRRRTLASYIRSKSREDSTGNSVIEEEEETVQEEKQGDK